MCDSPGLVDFAIGLVIFVFNLPNGQVLFFQGNSYYRRIVFNPANQKGFYLGLVEMTCGPVNASYSLPQWQAVKLTFSAPWCYIVQMSKWNKTINVWCIWRHMVALTLNAGIANIFMRRNALINRGYYMAALRYEISLWVSKIFHEWAQRTSEILFQHLY